jgi:hypothetical protein
MKMFESDKGYEQYRINLVTDKDGQFVRASFSTMDGSQSVEISSFKTDVLREVPNLLETWKSILLTTLEFYLHESGRTLIRTQEFPTHEGN